MTWLSAQKKSQSLFDLLRKSGHFLKNTNAIKSEVFYSMLHVALHWKLRRYNNLYHHRICLIINRYVTILVTHHRERYLYHHFSISYYKSDGLGDASPKLSLCP